MRLSPTTFCVAISDGTITVVMTTEAAVLVTQINNTVVVAVTGLPIKLPAQSNTLLIYV
jgi:hypothetical protein